jgi:SagB-type dehydrogenase family enzyme
VPARDPLATVRDYHEQTKHHFNRFARSLGYLDWATQPEPFRTFPGCRRVDLVDALRTAGTPETSGAPTSPGLPAVSQFLRYSLGLSAWKQAGPSRWALRVNPSSGNLHPTEGYIVCGPGVAGEKPGVYHYAPDAHALEERCVLDPGEWPAGAFLAALTSIHWREAWKYGERAFRYCQHDIGHAVAAMRIAAAMMGWSCRVVPGWSSTRLAALLGLDRDTDFEGAEREEPACLMVVVPGAAREATRAAGVVAEAADGLAGEAARGDWSGRASRLSIDRVQWDWIDAVAEASRDGGCRGPDAGLAEPDRTVYAASLVLRRRSAMAMDGSTAMSLDRFVGLLRRLMPAAGPPFDAFPWTPRIHLALFVHRVEGLQPGLYALPRTGAGAALLRGALNPDFAWVTPPGVPGDVPLVLLDHADCRAIARQLSCGQDIAADGCFSLGMLAEFDAALDEAGPAAYRHLFWEAGAVGQALYLEAEAAGLRGTGIGCYFDDGVHRLLGIASRSVQSLYHFTVGGPVDDTRLTTQPGYPWESR